MKNAKRLLNKLFKVVILIVGITSFIMFFIMELRYLSGIAAMKKTDYAEAARVFYGIAGYRNSEFHAEECSDLYLECIKERSGSSDDLATSIVTNGSDVFKEDITDFLEKHNVTYKEDSNEIVVSAEYIKTKRLLFWYTPVYEYSNITFFGINDIDKISLSFDNNNKLTEYEISVHNCVIDFDVYHYLVETISENIGKPNMTNSYSYAYWNNLTVEVGYGYPYEEKLSGQYVFTQKESFLTVKFINE